MARFLIRLIVSLLIILFVLPANASKNKYNVLHIQSYTEKDTSSKDLNDGLRKGFSDTYLSVEIVTEYLNSRFWDNEDEEEIMRQICRRADEWGADLIVVSNDEALHTLLVCGDPLPRRIPIVFFGVEYPDQGLINQFPNITGLTSPHPYDKLLETARYIFPERKEFVLLSESSLLGAKGTEMFMTHWDEFTRSNSGYTLDKFDLAKEPIAKVLNRIHLSEAAQQSIIIAPYWGLYMPAVTKVSKSPSFTLNSSSLMQGVFGVIAPNPYKDSRDAARIAVWILKGTPAGSIPIRQSDCEMVFDNKQLKFFNVGKKRLPQSAIVVNQTRMEKYGTYLILFYILLLMLLVFWVVRLFAMNRREARKRMQVQTRLLIQSRLVEQRNEFDNVFHSIPDSVVTYDNDLRIHFVNRATLQMAGVLDLIEEGDISAYEGKTAGSICALFHNGENILKPMLEKVCKEGVSIRIPEGAFVQSIQTQKFFPVSGEVLPILSHGKQTGLAVTFRNVSQEALQKRFFNLAVEESLVYPWRYEQDIYSFIFPAGYVARMGFDDTTVYRKDLDSRIHPEDVAHAVSAFDEAVKKQLQNVQFTCRQMNAEGVYEWWEFRASAIRGVSEEVPFSVLGVCQSIQQFKDTETELILARDKALEADKLKSAFLANMSHEIRTPLNAIVGFSDLLKDIELFSEEEIHSFIITINKNCELLLALINDVLDLSRVESGAMDFQFSPYYLPIIMQEIYDSQRLNIPSEVEFILSIPDGSERTIVTDPLRIKQVVNNLINNAVKFTHKGFIKFGYTEEEEYTTFFVSDTGAGISGENQRQVFERFYKVDNFTQGAGLGLSICHTIVSRLHGTIWVESELEKGTTFFVRVPNEIE